MAEAEHGAEGMSNAPAILAIESSCDDTAAAVLRGGRVLSNIIATQNVHEQYGGVVPEIASRAHLQNIVPVVDVALKEAGVAKRELNAVAFTQAPGLIGSLLVGSCFAKSLAQALDIPTIAVNHLRAHVLAHFIDEPKPGFPFLCLTVSGGHTQLVLCHDHYHFEVLGTTLDDAAGEAFDKTAKMLGLPYPGGPLVDKHAQAGDPHRFSFPISNIPALDFSFSGIKTSVLYFLQKEARKDPGFVQSNLAHLCASIQHTIIATLMEKLESAAVQTGVTHIGIAGGVSANSGLRARFEGRGRELEWTTHIPQFQYCTDNAAMIGIAAHYQYLAGDFAPMSAVPSARAAL
jgi:N6-L-threonylcarbamoyladenine synthase